MKPDIAGMLSYLRRGSGQNQREAATGLGISQALLSHYENGVREPRLEFIVRACDYYGVSADFLLGRTDAEDTVPGGAPSGWCAALENSLDGDSAEAFGKFMSVVLTGIVKTAENEPCAAYDAAAQLLRLQIKPADIKKLRLICAEMFGTSREEVRELISSIGGKTDI